MRCLWLPILFLHVVREGSGREFFLIEEGKSWTEAQSYCKEHHTDLATVSSASDLQDLCDGDRCNNAWIGLNNAKNNAARRWRWSLRGQEYIEQTERWSQGEPSDHEGKENCVVVRWNKKLSVDSCCKTHRFICYDRTSNTSVVVHQKKRWFEALDICRKKGTDLLSGWSQLKSLGPGRWWISLWSGPWWIGLFRDPWTWSDHNPSTFRNWHSREGMMCEDASQTFGQCAALGDGLTWMSQECHQENPFICYSDMILIHEKLSWEDAENYCKERYQGHLATINSEAQQARARAALRARQAQTDHVWLGAGYTCLLELWRWTSGEFVVYEQWRSDVQPSEYGEAAAMEARGEHKWVKKSENEELNFICEGASGEVDHVEQAG